MLNININLINKTISSIISRSLKLVRISRNINVIIAK